MFIPIWIFHIIVTIIMLVSIFVTFLKSEAFDLMPFIIVPIIIICYLLYWIIILVIR